MRNPLFIVVLVDFMYACRLFANFFSEKNSRFRYTITIFLKNIVDLEFILYLCTYILNKV